MPGACPKTNEGGSFREKPLAGAQHLEGKSRIAVIPHGYLHYLPFEALMNNGRFLVEQNIKLFYRALKNTNKIDALHTARKTMIEVYGKRHPYYWAAFVLIGDYR